MYMLICETGPAEKEKAFYTLRTEDDDHFIHHSLKGAQRRQHRYTLEDWEKATVCTLTSFINFYQSFY